MEYSITVWLIWVHPIMKRERNITTKKQITNYIKDNKLIVNINNDTNIRYRDVLRGGRTECYVHKYKINPDTHCIRGMDLTSLYPSLMLLNLPLKNSVVVDGGDT